MLAHIAIDVLPCQALSVPCECLFSACKETATDHCSRLSSKKFEQLQVLKFAWCADISNLAASNQQDEEIVDLSTYEVLFAKDVEEAAIDRNFCVDNDYVFIES